MRGKTVALLVLALGCGLVASIGITQVLAKRGDQAAQGDTLPVYLAKADIPPGTITTADNFKLEQWPKDKLPAGAILRQEDVDGRRARYKIFAGQPILEPMLLGKGEVPIDGQIPKGLRVVPITVSAEAIHSGLVLPGSRCDVQVFIRADPSSGIGETMSKTILQDIRVFAVNDITTTESTDPHEPEKKSIPLGKTVSLLVTPTQAEIVTLASQLGTIRLILRSAEDNEQLKSNPMTAHELLGAYGGANRAKENPQAADEGGFNKWAEMMKNALKRSANTNQEPKPPEQARYIMRVRTGPEVSDVLMVANSGASDEAAWTAMNLPSRAKSGPEERNVRPVDAAPAAGPAKSQNDAPLPFPKVSGKPPLGG
jgi:pilus assembly protein CpaB